MNYIRGDTTINGNSFFSGNSFVKGSSALQFGDGYTREQNAGQISYGMHDGGEEGSLNIVGAGKSSTDRRVRVWDKLLVNTICSADGSNCVNISDIVNKNGRYTVENADGRRLQMSGGEARAVNNDRWGNWEQMRFYN